MRTAIVLALLAVIPVLSYAGDDPKPKPAAEQAPQQPKADSQPAVQSPKATIPSGPQNGEQPGKPASALTPETDPIKLAAPAPSSGAKSAVESSPEKSYVIGAEDKLDIVVWNNAALSGAFIVRPDGRISMGLIGEIRASGMTPEQLQAEIKQRLKDGGFLRDPTVTVNVTGFNSKKYYIVGEVNHTGFFPLVVPTRVSQALVNAGGFKDFANRSKILILRGNERFKFNYNQVMSGKNREQDILLQPDDQIIVK